MIYTVTKSLTYKGKVFLPGQIIKLTEKELILFADKIKASNIRTK